MQQINTGKMVTNLKLRVQRTARKLVKGLENKCYEKQPKNWGSLVWRKGGSGDTFSLSTTTWKGGCSKVGVGLFSQVTSDRTRVHGLQLCQGRFTL